MTTPQQTFRPPEFDGLVVEDAQGVRLLALPAAVLPVLRSAAVLRFRCGDSVFNMRVTRTGHQLVTQARDEMAPKVEPPERSTGSAPTSEYGAPALPVYATATPSPATPPAPEQEKSDPANIPLRVWRGGGWTTTYVTRSEYDRFKAAGKISTEAPADRPDEGTEQ
jgi:hypothetical protein